MSRVFQVATPDGFHALGEYVCLYHGGGTGRWLCHNPLDCDLAPLFVPTRAEIDRQTRPSSDPGAGEVGK